MPKRRHSAHPRSPTRRRWARGANHHPEADLSALPLAAGGGRRERRRRGGPGTPVPLVTLIAIGAGVGIAYVSQTAHGTQATYQATSLTAERDSLRTENDRMANELGRLSSAERIVSAAQKLGMRPAGQWVHVASAPVPVIPPPQRLTAQTTDGGQGISRVFAALTGTFASHEARSSP